MGGGLPLCPQREGGTLLPMPSWAEGRCWSACIGQQDREPDSRASAQPTADVFLPTLHQCSPHSPRITAPSPACPLHCSLRGCRLHLGPVASSLCQALQLGDEAGTCRQSGAQTKRLQPLAPPVFRGNQGWGRRLHVCRLSLATAHRTHVTTSAKHGGPVPGHRGWGPEVVETGLRARWA